MIFHVLNGDTLAGIFPEAIPGERIIFREALVDGPVNPTANLALWEVRAEFILKDYPNSSSQDYYQFSYLEILKIKSIPSGAKIYLWFEEDLFCQVNLWFILNYLKDQDIDVFLVLPFKDSPYHFSLMQEQELIESYQSKAHALSRKEMEILARIWTHFQHEEVYEALLIADSFQERFPFLKLAVEAWRDSIPVGDYPGKPKATILEIQKELQTTEFEPIFREFQNRLPIYGFGDLQVKKMGKELGIFS